MNTDSNKLISYIKIIAVILVFIICIGLLIFESYTLFIVYDEGNAVMPSNFGNFEKVRNILDDRPAKDEFSFAVIGDSRGYGALGYATFEEIMERLKDENLSFLVLLGDCVYKGTPYFHMYFKSEWSEELATKYPTFYLPGNHDIGKDFTLSEFEDQYGPAIFSFEHQGNLFIFLNVLPEPYTIDGSIAFLESMLPFDRSAYNKVFVFMHAPITVQSTHSTKKVIDGDKLFPLFKDLGVDYVYAGDYHGYFREEHDGIDYIVTGGGGAKLIKAKFGQFYHALIVTVRRDGGVFEEILQVAEARSLEDSMECLAMSEIYPFIKNNRILVIIINIAILLVLIFSYRIMYYCIRRFRNK